MSPGGEEVRNAGLGTTTPISSRVQNCNSHQSLSLVFTWSLVEEVSAGSRSLREGPRRSASAAKPGRLLHNSSGPSSELGGRYPSQISGPLGRLGPEVWHRFPVGELQ